MDKIQEEFDKANKAGKFSFLLEDNSRITLVKKGFNEGYKSADLLPTEKVCPECRAYKLKDYTKTINEISQPICKICNNGTIQLYYTPEQYKEIMGKPYPDNCIVWYKGMTEEYFHMTYKLAKSLKEFENNDPCYIVQTAQSAPPADYRPEE